MKKKGLGGEELGCFLRLGAVLLLLLLLLWLWLWPLLVLVLVLCSP